MKKSISYIVSIVSFVFALFVCANFQTVNSSKACGTLEYSKTVTTAISDSAGGTVSGGGSFCLSYLGGSKSGTVEVIINPGYEFLGWYNGDTFLSSEEVYPITINSRSPSVYTAKVQKIVGFEVSFISDKYSTPKYSFKGFNAGTELTLSEYFNFSKGHYLDYYEINGERYDQATYVVNSNVTIKVVSAAYLLYGSGDNQLYHSIEEAYASNVKTFYFVGDTIISESFEIKDGYTFILPYTLGGTSEWTKGTETNATSEFSWSTQALIDKYLCLTVTINTGVKITVDGSLVVGAVIHYPDQSVQAHTSGAYSHLVNNGIIELVNGGTLTTYGLVTGSGDIIANSGTKIVEPFVISDFAGGTNAEAYYNEGVLPFTQFATVNIKCHKIIKYGAYVDGIASIYARVFISSDINISTASVIAPIGKTAAINMHEGSEIRTSYEHRTLNFKLGNANLVDIGVTTLNMYGTLSLGEFSIQGFGTSDKFFNMPYTFNFVLEEGATLNVISNRQYKILPGAKVLVKEGATVVVDGTLVVYDGFEQTTKSGKYYPTPEMLSTGNKFSTSGNLVVEGLLKINGIFAGTVQTQNNGMVEVADSATLSTTTYEGSVKGYDSNHNNRTEHTVTARAYGLSGFYNLEVGKTYKAYDNAEFIMSSFTYYRVKDTKNYTVEINETMVGILLEWNGTKYVAPVKHYIGSTLETAISIGFGENIALVGLDGYVTVTHTFDKGETIYYYTLNKEISTTRLHSFDINLYDEYILLDEVVNYLNVAPGKHEILVSEYEAMENGYVVEGNVYFYGEKSEPITYNGLTVDGSKYVYTKVLSHNNYTNINLEITLTVIPDEFEEYNNKVGLLENSSNLLEDATNLYEEYVGYKTIAESMDSDDYLFVTGHLKSDYSGCIVKSLTLESATYGDVSASAVATYLNDNSKNVEVSTTLPDGVESNSEDKLNPVFYYKVEYGEASYVLSITPDTLNKKEIEVIIHNKEIAYLDADVELTAELSANNILIEGDKLEDIITLTRETGSTVSVYAITGACVHEGYDVTFTSGTYTIKPLKVSYSVINSRLNVKEDDKSTVASLFSVSEESDVDLSSLVRYEIRKGETVVATIEDGELTIVGDYKVDSYEVYAIVTDTVNYTVVSSTPATLNIVTKEAYYETSAEFVKATQEYNGEVVDFTVKANIVGTTTQVEYDTIIYKDGEVVSSIKEVGTYTVSVVVDGVTYVHEETTTVTPIKLDIAVQNTTFTYNGSVQNPDITLVKDNVVGEEEVELSSINYTSENAGTYTVDLSLTGKGSSNYELTQTSVSYVINKLNVSYSVINSSLNVKEDDKSTVASLFSVLEESDVDLSSLVRYEIRKGETVVATIEDGELTSVGDYKVDSYEVYAILTDTVNYTVVSSTPATLNIVTKEAYYETSVEFVKATQEYNGEVVDFTVKANIVGTTTQVEYDIIIYKDGEVVSSIKEVGTYTVSVVVDGVTYVHEETTTVTPIKLDIAVQNTTFTYNGAVQNPDITLVKDNVVGEEEVELSSINYTSENAGTYTVDLSLTGKGSSNYVLAQTSVNYVINKLNVSYKVDDHKSLMDSDKKTVNFTVTEISGLDLSAVVRYEIKNGADLVATIEDGEFTIVGNYVAGVTYDVYAIIIDTVNYNVISSEKGTFSVIADDLYYNFEITFDRTDFTYNGEPVGINVKVNIDETNAPVTNFYYSINDGDVEEIIDVGNYTIDVVVDGKAYNNKASITITPIKLDVNVDQTAFTYNGSVQHPNITLVKDNVVDGEDVELKGITFTGINADTYTVNLNLDGEDISNYELAQTSVTYTINPLGISYSVDHHNDVMYKNRRNVRFTVTETSGWDLSSLVRYEIRKGTDVVVKIENGELTVVGDYKADTYEVYAIVTDTVNYTVVESLPTTLNVVTNEAYYETSVEFTKATQEYNGEVVNFTVEAKIKDTGVSVGYETIIYKNGEVVSSIKDAGTYTVSVVVDGITYNHDVTTVVTPIKLDVNVDQTTFTYNGSVQNPNITLIKDNVVSGEEVELKGITFTGINAGTYTVNLNLDGEDISNYELAQTSVTYTINPLGISYSVDHHNDVMYKNRRNVRFTVTETSGWDLSSLVRYEIRKGTDVVVKIENGELTVVGDYKADTYEVYAVVTDTVNYTVVESLPTTLNVVTNEAYYETSVEFTKATQEYNGEVVNFTVEAKIKDTGVSVGYETIIYKNGEVVSSIKDAGTYTVSVVVDGITYNHDVTTVVTPIKLDVNVDQTTFIYNGSVQHPNITLVKDNVVDGDDVSLNNVNYTSKNVNGYMTEISLIGEESFNYMLVQTRVMYRIDPKPATVSIMKTSSVYGNTLSKLMFTSEDIESVDDATKFIVLSKEDGIDVGTYDITGVNKNANYTVTFINGEDAYEVIARKITVAVKNVSIAYGELEQELEYSITSGSLVYEDNLNDVVNVYRESGVVVGTYQVKVDALSKNYDVSSTKSTYSITPRYIELLVNDASSYYGDNYSKLTVSIKSGSMAYDEDVYTLVDLSSDYDVTAGEYKILAENKNNPNYNVSIVYTKALYSTYTVNKRIVVIRANDVEAEYDISYDDLYSMLGYTIVDGSIVNNDFDVVIRIELQNGYILTKDNFAYTFGGGTHSIVVEAEHDNYDLVLINGELNVTKCYVSVEGIQTNYVYQDGEEIEVFNWKENIKGYNASANDNSFGYVIMKTIDGVAQPVDSVSEVGEYSLWISVIHNHAYEFVAGTQTRYTITVNKKDITNRLSFFNIPNGNRTEYNKLGFIPGVELPEEYMYVNYYEYITLDGEFVDEINEVGIYIYGVVIEDDSYTGGKLFEIEVYKKDVTKDITVNVESNDVLVAPTKEDIEAIVKNTNVNITYEYVYVGETEEVVTDISKPGNYKVTIRVDDDNYHGVHNLSFRVIASIEEEMNSLMGYVGEFEVEVDSSNKLEIIKSVKAIIKGFDEDAWGQIENREDYASIISECEAMYIDFKNTIEVQVEETEKITRATEVITFTSSLSILALLLKRKKWRLG